MHLWRRNLGWKIDISKFCEQSFLRVSHYSSYLIASTCQERY
jgi:hypothetical protein